jgi:hypothetical protein
MIVITATSTKDFQPSKLVKWSETSSWSGSIVERTGIVESISRAQSGCYFVQLNNDRTICLEIESSLN